MAIKLTIELIRFLNAAKRLYNQNALTKSQILDFARREFGEVTGVLKTRLDKLFQKPATGIKKQETKKGEIVPMKNVTPKKEGIASLDPPKLDSKENIMGAIDKLKNPRRPGGPLDPVMGVTRTLARRVLEKRNIEIGKKDPIDVFIDTFGESVTDLKNLGEEIVEAEQIGRNLKPVDDLLEIEGFFDIKIPKNPNKGIPTEDVVEMLEKDLKEKEMVENALQTIADRKRLGTRSQESFIRSAVREFLERRLKDGSLTIPDKKDLDAITGVRQGGVDPIDVFRKAYGEDAIATVARMEEQFPDAFQGSSFKEIGDEFEKLFKREAENFGSELPKPKEKYGFDEGLMTDQQLREMLEKDLREKQMLEDFDPTDRTKNADGGLAEILKV